MDEYLFTKSFDSQVDLIERSKREIVVPRVQKTSDKMDVTTPSPKEKPDTHQFNNVSRKFRLKDQQEVMGDISQHVSEIKLKDEQSKLKQNIAPEMMIVPPPINPDHLPKINTESAAHASMLTSWYMAGYHTGYYEAMKRLKK